LMAVGVTLGELRERRAAAREAEGAAGRSRQRPPSLYGWSLSR
jgi:hypothetical protein